MTHHQPCPSTLSYGPIHLTGTLLFSSSRWPFVHVPVSVLCLLATVGKKLPNIQGYTTAVATAKTEQPRLSAASEEAEEGDCVQSPLVKHITVMTSTASRCRGTLQRHNAWRSLVSTVSKQKPLWRETDLWFGPSSRSWWFKPGREWLSNQIWGEGSEGKETKRGEGWGGEDRGR